MTPTAAETALVILRAANARETAAMATHRIAFDRYYIARDESHESWLAMKAAESEKRKARIARTKASNVFKAACAC